MKRRSLDRKLAKQNPERVFDSPLEVVVETLFTRGEKLGTLDRWRLNVLEDVGANGAGSKRVWILGQIEQAKRRLIRPPT
jgi:hypothetical protein